MPVTIF